MNKRFLYLATILSLMVSLSVFNSCKPDNVETVELVLTASTTTIFADSMDYVTFKVTRNDEDVTAKSHIYCKELEVDLLPDSVFYAKEVGTYTFYASYKNDGTSNTVTVEAIEPQIDPEEKFFDIILTDLNATGVNMRVEPIGYDGGYYFDVLSEENYAYYNENGWQELIDYTVYNIANDYQMPYEEALAAIMSFGADEWTFYGLEYDAAYYAVVMGLDGEGAICTEIEIEPFRTPDVEIVDNTFEITVSNVTYTGVEYTVVPSNKEETYFTCTISKVVADELALDEAIAGYCLSIYPDPNEQLKRGDYTSRGSGGHQPGRDFYAVAFGYTQGVVTTDVTKVAFSTPTDGDPATCTFEISVGNVTHNSARVSVKPSNEYNVYFTELIAVEDVEALKEYIGSDDMQDVMETYWNDGILPMITEGYGMSPAQFADMMCMWGEYGTKYGYLDMATEYMAFAVCLDAYGQPVGDFYLSESFTTETEVISSATAEIKVIGYFNGDEIEGEWNLPGEAVVVMEITPSDDAECWYSDLFAYDVSGSSRYNHIQNLTVYGGEYMPRILIKSTPWNFECTALSVAQDADENFGLVSWEVFECYKDNALPTEDFYEYEAAARASVSSVADFSKKHKFETRLYRGMAPRK